MRPKFRAWDKKRNEWFRHGELRLDMNGNIYLDCMKEPCNDRFDIVWFTGLHDKKQTKEYPKGQEIYKGGIVRVLFGEEELIYVCEYYDEVGAWVFRGNGEWLMYEDVFETCVIIGSIHETPELLEAKQ